MLVSAEINPKKQTLMDVACTLFRQKGYHGASMRDLAKEMNIEAASLYNYIQSKQEILKFVCFSIAQKFDYSIEGKESNAKIALSNAIKKHILILLNNVDASHVFSNEWKNLEQIELDIFVQKRKLYQNYYESLLTNGKEQGFFRDIDSKFGAITILSSINGIVDWYNPNGKIQPKEIITKTTQILLKGIKK